MTAVMNRRKKKVYDRPIVMVQDGLRFVCKTESFVRVIKDEMIKLWGFTKKDKERYIFISEKDSKEISDGYYVIGLLYDENYKEMGKRLKAELKKDLERRR